MKKIGKAVVTMFIVSLMFPTFALAKENIPITVEKEGGEMGHTSKNAYINKMYIKENTSDAFSKQKQYCFSVKDMEFEQGQVVKVSGDSVGASVAFRDGNCILTIDSSDDTKQETITLEGISILSKKYDVLPVGTYALYLDSPKTGKIAVLEEFIRVNQTKQEMKQEKLNLSLQVGNKTFSVNGQKKKMLVPAYISDTGYTMLPVREVAKIFPKTEANWKNETKTATFRFANQKAVVIKAGTAEMEVNDKKQKLQTKAEMKDGRMFVSLRDISHICAIPYEDIHWNSGTKTVTVDTEFVAE